MRVVELHTEAEIDAEVERLRSPPLCVWGLVTAGVVRSWCVEADLRVEAYNQLTMQKFASPIS